PYKSYNGRILFRTKSETHQKLEALAVAKGVSVNKLLDKIVENEIAAMN
ncbi:toxin-antitoxin system HicB family antitoxin, partial [Vibrio parahaemolyticus]